MVFVLMAAYIIWGLIYYILPQYSGNDLDIKITNETVDMDNSAQGNYVLYRAGNDGRPFPFDGGERLCVYDIDTNKSTTIVCNIGPMWMIDNDFSLGKNVALYSAGSGDGQGSLFSINIKTGKKHKLEESVTDFVISGNRVYYVSNYFQDDHKSTVYSKPVEGGKHKKIFSGHTTCMTVKGSNIYRFDSKLKKIIITDNKTGIETKIAYPFSEDISKICAIDKGGFITMDTAGRLCKFDKTHLQGMLTKVKGTFEFAKNIYYRKGKVYCYDDNYKLQSIDLKTGRQVCLIDLAKNPLIGGHFASVENGTYANFSYCKDYIAVDLYYELNDESTIEKVLIYDYSGKYIKKISHDYIS